MVRARLDAAGTPRSRHGRLPSEDGSVPRLEADPSFPHHRSDWDPARSPHGRETSERHQCSPTVKMGCEEAHDSTGGQSLLPDGYIRCSYADHVRRRHLCFRQTPGRDPEVFQGHQFSPMGTCSSLRERQPWEPPGRHLFRTSEVGESTALLGGGPTLDTRGMPPRSIPGSLQGYSHLARYQSRIIRGEVGAGDRGRGRDSSHIYRYPLRYPHSISPRYDPKVRDASHSS